MLIAGPNLTIDRTSTIPALRPGEVLRLSDVVVTPGGKGLNVARAARALGVPAMLVAFLPGRTGRATGELIAAEGVRLAGVTVDGEIRSTAIILEADGRATVLNEPGPPLADEDWMAYEAAVGAALDDHGVLVCSGSLPPEAPEDGYGRLVRRAHANACPAVVDANGPALRAALGHGVDVVTPNVAEAEGLLHGRADESVEASPDARPRSEAAALGLVDAGARAAIVTAAAAGAAVAVGTEATWVPAPRVEEVRNPIGAGDVLTAAVAAAIEEGAEVLEAARRGVAAAAASVEAPLAGDLLVERMSEFL
ncbi:MAG TPA: PfkB family carbohydrate kinase [Solirubrobacteraceae bacterium]|nr:PfkB family carbohydrate kinase [Solirubrobacteraceae bacterium]